MASSRSLHRKVDPSSVPQTTAYSRANSATGKLSFLSQDQPSCEHQKDPASTICRACYNALRLSTEVELTCTGCSKPMTLKRYDYTKRIARGVKQFFCGRPCNLAHRRKVAASTNNYPCRTCGGKAKKGNWYCSPTCWPEKKIRPRKYPDIQCPQCSKMFSRVNSRQQFCSRQCSSAAHSTRMMGEGNSHYKDGTSYAEWFRLMKPVILERDGAECVVCKLPHEMIPNGRGHLKSILVIHHCDENPANNEAWNLIAMCQPCHMKHHKSPTTPFPWLSELAQARSRSMTFRLKRRSAFLRKKFSSTTA